MSERSTPRWPQYDAEQIDAVAEVLRSGKVNAWTGPDVRAFEEAYAAYLGTPHAIAFANGSVSLNAALEALVGNGLSAEERLCCT